MSRNHLLQTQSVAEVLTRIKRRELPAVAVIFLPPALILATAPGLQGLATWMLATGAAALAACVYFGYAVRSVYSRGIFACIRQTTVSGAAVVDALGLITFRYVALPLILSLPIMVWNQFDPLAVSVAALWVTTLWAVAFFTAVFAAAQATSADTRQTAFDCAVITLAYLSVLLLGPPSPATPVLLAYVLLAAILVARHDFIAGFDNHPQLDV
ncbi:MAG: hypothetical protein AB7S38_42000 [Vulcanimicrobiota bacterium]